VGQASQGGADAGPAARPGPPPARGGYVGGGRRGRARRGPRARGSTPGPVRPGRAGWPRRPIHRPSVTDL